MSNHEQYQPDFGARAGGTELPDFELRRENILRTNKDLQIKEVFKVLDTEVRQVKGQRFGRTEFSTLVVGSVYSVATSDYLIAITHLSYAPSVGLPDAQLVGPGKSYIVKDEAGGAGTTTITVRSAGERNIDGASTATITSNYGTVRLYTDGANWFTR